jgi:hypothetical protein
MKVKSGYKNLACEKHVEEIRNDSSIPFEHKVFLINRARNYWLQMNKTKYRYGTIKKCKPVLVEVGITKRSKKGKNRAKNILPWE